MPSQWDAEGGTECAGTSPISFYEVVDVVKDVVGTDDTEGRFPFLVLGR